METIEVETNKLLQKIYKFLDKIENTLPNELSKECNRIKHATKKIITGEHKTTTTTTRYYENILDDLPQHKSSNSAQFEHTRSSSAKQPIKETVPKEFVSEITVYKKSLEAIENGIKLAKEKNRPIIAMPIPRHNSEREHYMNNQLSNPRHHHHSPTYNAKFSSSADEYRRTTQEKEYKFTNNDVVLTLMSPPKDSNVFFPKTDTHLYENTRLTSPKDFHRK